MNINLTLIGQSISFLFFIWFCKKFVWTALISSMEERQKKIADGLDAADKASRDLEAAKEKVSEKLKDAKKEASTIIEQANKRASQIIDEAKDQAKTEAERLKAGAIAEIDMEVNRAKEELRSKVAILALAGAEKILQANIDEKTNAALVNDLASQL